MMKKSNKKNRAKAPGLFGAESSLRLLACRGRTASLLRQCKNLRGLAGTHQQGAIPQAPEHLRFDSWSRHWSIGLKKGAKS
ncbi:hypothetical protein NBRC111894_4663 [Sporolactobacillus inulinus]|uniref:Uncharacterized protein n=1 Tax=Sporolactobacillus inulinus TaxID=2078 RepID=A0A4Y1ZJA5_9BACL|nr:hypothetical protein NBRC111894_4663 [Sporolactobacillus inulinus]